MAKAPRATTLLTAPTEAQALLTGAWHKKWDNRLDECTEQEVGVLHGYEDGYTCGLGEQDDGLWGDESEAYTDAYMAGFTIGNAEA